MAHKKAGGSSRNGRDSAGQHRGIKCYGGERVKAGNVNEIILALNPTMEGDTTNFYISRRLADSNVKLSVLARGVSIGDDLEYTDEVTLGRSILARTPLK